MKFNVASSMLALFALLGLGLTIYSDYENSVRLLICILLYVLIPAYGAYGTFVKSRSAIIVSILFFSLQSIRSVGTDSLLPHIAPITISFPIGNFSSGQGYLIDFFAIFMAIFLAWLLKEVISVNKLINVDK